MVDTSLLLAKSELEQDIATAESFTLGSQVSALASKYGISTTSKPVLLGALQGRLNPINEEIEFQRMGTKPSIDESKTQTTSNQKGINPLWILGGLLLLAL